MKFSKRTKETQILRWHSDKNAVLDYKDEIRPMTEVVPKWYKEIKRWAELGKNDIKPFDKSMGELERWPTVKHCLPFFDGITTGYALVLTENIYVEQTPDGPVIRWQDSDKQKMPPVNSRPPYATDPMPTPVGYAKEHFIWTKQMVVKPPDGYSILYTHPLNRFDLPFLTVSAVVDDYAMPGANISFYIKEGFEGEILAGTPVAQLIPYKRENWKSLKDKSVLVESQHSRAPMKELILEGWYRKNVWKKKTYQ